MSINEIFGNENQEMNANPRILGGTAELTRVSKNIALNIVRSMEQQIEIYKPRISESATDAKKMDELLNEFRPWVDIEEDSPLRDLDEETVDSMLKSQQSKRSRCKAKAMTLDNYIALMTATIAESLLREMYNKPKSAAFGHRATRALDYTPAQLEEYEADQEKLRKEIRNVQSKKSIMKSKADFDESSEAWQALLKAEQMLKDLRVGGHSTVVEVDHTKNALAAKLDGIDLEHLKAADSKELLKDIMSMLSGEESTDAEA